MLGLMWCQKNLSYVAVSSNVNGVCSLWSVAMESTVYMLLSGQINQGFAMVLEQGLHI